LVVLAVLAGAMFLDRAQRLVPVYAAARDLPAGTQLRNGDLVVLRVRLPDTALRHYLRPSPERAVAGLLLVAPVRREELVPAGLVLASSRDVDLVELPVQVEPGDMAQGLRPGDRVQVLAAFTEGARRGRAVVLLPTAEVVRLLQDPTGLTGAGEERGVQLRMPSDRAPAVAAAIATARIFVVKAPGPAPGGAEGTGPAGRGQVGPGQESGAGSEGTGPEDTGSAGAGSDPGAGSQGTGSVGPGQSGTAPAGTAPAGTGLVGSNPTGPDPGSVESTQPSRPGSVR
jgi:hypothetical protein